MATSNVPAEGPSYPMASLYVGDLHPDVTEAMLFDKFASAGPILSIRVCRDMITRPSLGYAYVNFQQPADAERALNTMNFDLLRGRPLRIMWSQQNPALRQSAVGNVFIENLDKNIDNKSLYDTFSAFGNILSCKIMTDENGQSKGFGFIHFETEEAADNAINKVNGMLLADQKVFVSRFMSRNQHADADEPRKFTIIFIKNFGDQLDEEELRELFSQYGKILSFKIERDENGVSKGFGFCSFEKPEEAEDAVQKSNGYSIGDKQLFVGRFLEKNERLSEIKRKKDMQTQERMTKYQGVNLYIKNLDDTIDDERLRKEFSKYGTITSAKIMSENDRSKGFGFVCFSAPDEATKAAREMHGTIVGSKPLYVALAQRQEERRMHLTNQHMQRIATSRVPPQIQLPYPNGMGGIMPYLATPMGPSQPRSFFQQTPMQSYRPAQLRWSSAATAAGMRQQANPQIIGMQMPQSAIAAAQRSAAMAGVPSRAGMPMQTRPTPTPGQMMPSGGIRPQTGMQPQPASTYTRTARNVPPNNQGGFSSSIVVAGQEPLTPAALANATPQEQKQMLGERLFPLIQQMQPELAGKITGMLLEIDNTELLHMLESRESLKAKVEEAIAVLQAHQAKQLYAAKQAANNSAASTYTCTARNVPPNNPGGFSSSIVVAGQEPLTPAALANATPQEQKQMLGERLLPLIQQMQPELAGKITGMLLEIDNTKLLHMLESRESLKAKVEEAIAVLQAHHAKQLYAAKQAANNSAASTYTCTARNVPPNSPGGFSSSIVVAGQEPLTPAALANATPQEQKQMLGERLLPLIQQMQPGLAGKITGMLLEIDNTELLHMLESRESIKAKVEEAIAVLQAHHAKQLYAAEQAANNSAAS